MGLPWPPRHSLTAAPIALVAPPHTQVRDPQLDVYAPTVAFSYIENRVLMAEAAVAGKIENDLDDEDLVLQQLEVLPVICRFVVVCVVVGETNRTNVA